MPSFLRQAQDRLFSINQKGFTLVELLVVIAILAVLTVIATATFTNIRKGANDAKRKADIEAIAKAYELKYSGSYQTLADNNFVSGQIPTPPQGGTYTTVYQNGDGFKVCAALENNIKLGVTNCGDTRSDYCYCLTSLQGAAASSGSGGYISHPYTCDTTGSLGLGLVGYWKMDEGSGSEARDSSGHSQTLALINVAWTTKFNSALSFGASSTASTADSSYISLTSGGTLAAWISSNRAYPGDDPTTTRYREIVNKFASGICTSTGAYILDWSGTNNTASFRGRICNGSPPARGIDYSTVLTPGQWYHIVYTWDGSYHRLYLNGAPVGTPVVQDTSSQDETSNLWVGNGFGGGYAWDGMIDDVRIYNKALSPTEVQNLYSGGAGCMPVP